MRPIFLTSLVLMVIIGVGIWLDLILPMPWGCRDERFF